jgi:hypothetical protein
VWDTVFIPVLGHIQAAETAPVFLNIRFGVHTGAEDVLVQIINPGSQAAWAGGVSIAIHIDEQAFQEVPDHLLILVEMKAFLGHELLKFLMIRVDLFRTYGTHRSLSSMKKKLYVSTPGGNIMDQQAELVNYLRQVIGEEGCCVSCNTDDVFFEDGTWKLKLENFLEPWELGETVDEAKARIREYASMGFGLA